MAGNADWALFKEDHCSYALISLKTSQKMACSVHAMGGIS